MWRNTSVGGSVHLVMSGDSDDNSWFIHEYDNVTVVDNAPYVGLRKVDSLIHYLLVCLLLMLPLSCIFGV